jgi:ribonuclease HI
MEHHDDNALVIYTDGSSLAKPRRGGFAFRFVFVDEAGEEVTHDFNSPGYLQATNNEMELMACIEALKCASGRRSPVPRSSFEKVVVYTDSMYVHDGVYQAEFVWPGRGWMTSEQEPVLSPDLWTDLVREKQRLGRVEFRKVKAHKTNPHNKAVDTLAKESAELANRKMLSPRTVRRKTSSRKTEPRGVLMRGQIETIKIITIRQIRGQRHHAYKYEVVDSESADFEAVDDAYALDGDVEMRPAHVYRVRFSESGRGRWLEEILEEIERTDAS